MYIPSEMIKISSYQTKTELCTSYADNGTVYVSYINIFYFVLIM